MDLKNAKVLITGGSSGIGRGTAKVLRDRGASVVICGRDQRKLEATAAELGVTGLVADVSQEGDVVKLIPKVIDVLDGYNVLINNAGFGSFGPLLTLQLEDMQRLFATNVFGAMLVGRESARHFSAQKSGNIINIASTAALRGFPNGSAYVASKMALTGLTECWRAELRKDNIRVMQVNPSEVLTSFSENSGREGQKPSEKKLRSEEIAQAIAGMLEMDNRGFVTDLTVWATNPD